MYQQSSVKQKITTKKLVLSAMFIALGLVLPFLTQVPSLGNRFLPMHLPVLVAGFVCGGPLGMMIGFVTPLLRSLLFGMPPIYPTALAMSFELATFGLLTGVLYRKLPKGILYTYTSLLVAMIGGRAVWGVVSFILFTIAGNAFTWQIFFAGAVLNAIPGIIFQLIVVPMLVTAFEKAKLILPDEIMNKKNQNTSI